jgi:uncharacterized protein YraI
MKRILFCLAPLCLALPALALATEGYVVADISLQAGPDTEYPAITELAAGTPVDIQGCIEGYSWCDVIVGNDRGWVAGSFVEEEYNNQPVVIEDYGPRIGIPIVAFSLGLYWESHYHNRPWFNERTQWEGRHIRPHQPPRPSAEAIRNAPHIRGGNTGNRDQNRAAPAATPVATPTPAPVQNAPARTAIPRPQTETTTQRPAPEMERQRSQPHAAPRPPAQPVATPKQEAPHPVAEPRTVQPTKNTPPVRQAPPKAEPKPKQEPKPKEEPKKDDGHKDDSKEH